MRGLLPDASAASAAAAASHPQIFNLINSRRINDEYNVFEGLHRSTLFLIILAVIVVFQVRASAVLCCAVLGDPGQQGTTVTPCRFACWTCLCSHEKQPAGQGRDYLQDLPVVTPWT
jgi:hypothetical protein